MIHQELGREADDAVRALPARISVRSFVHLRRPRAAPRQQLVRPGDPRAEAAARRCGGRRASRRRTSAGRGGTGTAAAPCWPAAVVVDQARRGRGRTARARRGRRHGRSRTTCRCSFTWSATGCPFASKRARVVPDQLARRGDRPPRPPGRRSATARPPHCSRRRRGRRGRRAGKTTVGALLPAAETTMMPSSSARRIRVFSSS